MYRRHFVRTVWFCTRSDQRFFEITYWEWNENERIAKFHKVSFEQFAKDWKDTFEQYSEEEIRNIYDSLKLPKRATTGSAGYDFMHLWM